MTPFRKRCLGATLALLARGAATQAHAAPAATPVAPLPPPPAPLPAPPAARPAPYTIPYPYAPSREGIPYGPALQAYQNASKSHGAALALEFFLPGAGSVYARDPRGAIVTWGLMTAGVAVAVWGLTRTNLRGGEQDRRGGNQQVGLTMLVGGVLVGVGGRIYGLVNSWQAVSEHNQELRASLRLPVWISLGAQRDTAGRLAAGPMVGGRF
jgi:hypothetical protein